MRIVVSHIQEDGSTKEQTKSPCLYLAQLLRDWGRYMQRSIEFCPTILNTHSLQNRGKSSSMYITFPLDFPPFCPLFCPLILPTIGHFAGSVIYLPGQAKPHFPELFLVHILESQVRLLGALESSNDAAVICSPHLLICRFNVMKLQLACNCSIFLWMLLHLFRLLTPIQVYDKWSCRIPLKPRSDTRILGSVHCYGILAHR